MKRLFGLYWLVVFIVIAASALVAIVILPGLRARRWVARTGAGLIFRLTGMAPRLTGGENLPTETCVVVANHASYLDGIILTAALPPRFAFVIKKEMTQVPLAHFFLRRIGSHFVERADTRKSASAARTILRSAHSGESLGFFPEGTFHKEPGLHRFHKGAFVIAARSGLPVVPAVIEGSRNILPDGRVLPGPGSITVTLLEPLAASGRDAETLSQLSRQRIVDKLGEPDLLVGSLDRDAGRQARPAQMT